MKVYILYILKVLNLLHTPIKSYEGKHFPYIRLLKECFFTAKLFQKSYKKKKKERERKIDREREKKKERERNIENVREREIEKIREWKKMINSIDVLTSAAGNTLHLKFTNESLDKQH